MSNEQDNNADDAPRVLWSELSRPGRPHPLIWHPWNVTAWSGAIGVGVASLDPSGLALGIGTAGAAVLGTAVGAGCVDVKHDSHRRFMYQGAALGTVTGLAEGAWCYAATNADLYENLWQPHMWGALGVGGLMWGVAYSLFRFGLQKVRNPKSKLAAKVRRKYHGDPWVRIFAEANFGTVTVDNVEDNWAGHSLVVELDDDKNMTSKHVLGAKNSIFGIARKVLKEEKGIVLSPDALTIEEVRDDAGKVKITVKERDVLSTPVIKPEHDMTEPATDDLCFVGRWQTGDLIELNALIPQIGGHGCSIGASRSGKSTYGRAMIAEHARRPHTIDWVAGISKFYGYIKPFMKPVVDGRARRPVFDMLGGGDEQGDAEFRSALQVLQAMYVLYLSRMSDPELPRDDGNNHIPSPEYPRVVGHFDEIDALIKFGKDNGTHKKFELPNGTKVSIPDMLTAIGSKGSSEGVCLEFGTQKLTDDFLGMAVSSVITNVGRRAVFYTPNGYDAGLALSDKERNHFKPNTFTNNMMVVKLGGQSGSVVPGKAFYYSSDELAEIAIAADQNDTIGTLSPREAAKLGQLYTERWNENRIASILRYFGGQLGNVAALTTVTANSARSTVESSADQGDGGTGRSGLIDPGETPQELRQGLRDIIARRRANQTGDGDGPTKDQNGPSGSPDWALDVMSQINELPVIDDDARTTRADVDDDSASTAGLPWPLDVLIEQFGDDPRRVIPNSELSEAASVPAGRLGMWLSTKCGVKPDNTPDAERGRAVADLKAAADRIRRGEINPDPMPEN